MEKRIVYYIVSASAENNQAGIFHFSKPFKSLAFCQQAAKKVKNDFVRIEKHHEKLRDNCHWEIDFDFEIEPIEIE